MLFFHKCSPIMRLITYDARINPATLGTYAQVPSADLSSKDCGFSMEYTTGIFNVTPASFSFFLHYFCKWTYGRLL